jgi:RNA recognition motif-containing protein
MPPSRTDSAVSDGSEPGDTRSRIRNGNLMPSVFIGNLASNRTPDELRELFQTYGPVEAVEIVTDPETRYSRGFAFVEMTNALEAKQAISQLNGVVMWGKSIRVEEVSTQTRNMERLVTSKAMINGRPRESKAQPDRQIG